MHIPDRPWTLPRRRTTTHPGRHWILLLALMLTMVLGAVQPSLSAAEPGGAGTPTVPRSGGAETPAEPQRVTLVTGDVVAWQRAADGTESAWIVEPATPDADPASARVYVQDGEAHVVPAEAAPYLRAGRLDPDLFNISLLVRQGLDDAERTTLPLLVEASGGRTAQRAPATPEGARTVRELDSIKTRSVLADKDEMRSVWESLRGPTIAREDAPDARLAGAGRVWLNGRVHATLGDSVPQIGAPEAWEAGYDGAGVEVAVLDSGWDPDHPDLQEVVSEARNFTQEQDPEGVHGLDRNGHGTHVAATVSGSGAASGGERKGVAPEADLMIGKVLDQSGSGWSDEIIAGMEWAATSGADVVNMSLGTTNASDGTDPFSQAVNALTESTGALFVVAAGNSGPDESTIGAPGAADLALTVGAVDGQDQAAEFSSRGPRLGDGAIKPEVVAPGVGIVAARAAGTSLGNLVDDHYTALDGTSMASPHVAGAAAILAQQHPDWDAAELKDRLVSTSLKLDEPVTFQGAGRVDVAAAVGRAVAVAPGALSLGDVAQDGDPVTRTLTYTNETDRPVVLRLTAKISSTGSDHGGRAEITFDDNVVRVPAHGSTEVAATLNPGSTKPGGYAGQVVAEVAGQAEKALHTTMSMIVAGPERTFTVQATDSNGEPATSGTVDLWNADTGAYDRLQIKDGEATATIQDGLYTAVTAIDSDATDAEPNSRVTITAEPELRIDGDQTLRYDARTARQMTVDTPRPTDVRDYDVLFARTVGDRSITTHVGGGLVNEDVFVIPSPAAETGTFTFATEWQLVQPLLTAVPSGDGDHPVSPNPEFASLGAPYVGDTTVEVVDAGDGAVEDYADHDVTGKAVLVTRSDASLREQADAARAAGAAILFVANDGLDRWTETTWGQEQPVYRMTRQAGASLRDALAADADLTLDVAGIADSTYNYELVFSHDQQVPDDVSYVVDHEDLAVVRSDYRENSDRSSRQEGWVPVIDDIGIGNIMGIRRNGPVKRTEYVSTEDVAWQRMAQPHGEFPGYYWTWSPERRYDAGEETDQQWWGPLVHPALIDGYGAPEIGSPAARFHDAIRVTMPHYSYGADIWCTAYGQFADTSELTLSSNGEPLGRADWSAGQFSVPAAAAEYELRLEVTNGKGNWVDTSVHTDSVWTFTSERADQKGEVLPLVQMEYDLATDAYNTVPADAPSALRIAPGYQPGADGPAGFSVTTEISYDDGATWEEASVEQQDGAFVATVPGGEEGGYASVRVTATDADGNSLRQQIDRAWGVRQAG